MVQNRGTRGLESESAGDSEIFACLAKMKGRRDFPGVRDAFFLWILLASRASCFYCLLFEAKWCTPSVRGAEIFGQLIS